MSDCARIDALVTPFVDGALSHDQRIAVERHVQACALCRARLDAEQSMSALVREHRAQLCDAAAPAALLTRCAQLAAPPPVPRTTPPSMWRSRALRFAIAATLVAAASAAAVYRLTETPVQLIAAELTADHLKCFILHGSPDSRPAVSEVEQSLETQFDWDATLPAQAEQAGLELVGARPCLYAEGRVAHILYRFEGRPVSVFMLPDRDRAQDLFDVMGHSAVMWSDDGRTFVLVAREPADEMQRLARFVRAGLH